MSSWKKTSDLKVPQVVGTIPSAAALREACKLRPGEVDLLELRIDHFADELGLLRKALPKLQIPFIVTVRHPKEGGANDLRIKRRAELYAEFLPLARYIDVELRSVTQLAPTIEAARKAGVQVILSAHFFESTPSLTRLTGLLENATQSNAGVFKLATFCRSFEDLRNLLRLLLSAEKPRMSVMGMGPLGMQARLVLAGAGSLLNYGYLDKVQVPGQWPARLLRKRLNEIGAVS